MSQYAKMFCAIRLILLFSMDSLFPIVFNKFQDSGTKILDGLFFTHCVQNVSSSHTYAMYKDKSQSPYCKKSFVSNHLMSCFGLLRVSSLQSVLIRNSHSYVDTTCRFCFLVCAQYLRLLCCQPIYVSAHIGYTLSQYLLTSHTLLQVNILSPSLCLVHTHTLLQVNILSPSLCLPLMQLYFSQFITVKQSTNVIISSVLLATCTVLLAASCVV